MAMATREEAWASLKPDIVRRIGDCLLDTNDVDTYVDMRAVCPAWRSAIPRPPPGADDLRFRPTQWVVLDVMCDQSRLFINVSTGRFLHRRLPSRRTHRMLGVAASSGLLLVEEFPEDDNNTVDVAAALLAINPFTGSMLRFPAIKTGRLPRGGILPAAISSSDPPMAVVRHRGTLGTYASAQPTSESFQKHFFDGTLFTSTVTFQGSVFMATTDGRVLKAAATPQEPGEFVVAKITRKMDISLQKEDRAHAVSSLVESHGELLLVRHCLMRPLKVFRVDLHQRRLEPLSSIGRSRALFLGEKRCVSVDAAKFPSVAGDCVYVHNTWELVFPPLMTFMYVYDLRGGTSQIIPRGWSTLAVLFIFSSSTADD